MTENQYLISLMLMDHWLKFLVPHIFLVTNFFKKKEVTSKTLLVIVKDCRILQRPQNYQQTLDCAN